jgi:hypothetical protein
LKTQESITTLRLTVLPHPPHSPDLPSSGFHLFGALKNAIRGRGFGNDDKVIEEVKEWLLIRCSCFLLAQGFEVDGDYVEGRVV